MISRFFLIVIAFLMVYGHASAQTSKSKKAQSYYEQAKSAYVKAEPGKALGLLDLAIGKDPRFTGAMLLKADIYHMLQKYSEETQMLKQAIAIDSMCYLPAYFNLGKADFMQGNYLQAIDWFKKYEQLSKNKKGVIGVTDWVEKARFANEALKNPFKFEPKDLGANVNSDFDEYWPSLTADDQTLVFTVLEPRDTNLYKMGNLPKSALYYQEDFYESKRGIDGGWLPRQRILPPLNTDGNEGAQSLSADGNWMFFTGCSRPEGLGSCDIYFSQRTATGWSRPVNVGAPVNTPFWESQPAFSADGRTLFFVSNRSGGIGQKDIWAAKVVTKKSNGVPVFGDLVNLGPAINTAGDENSPFIHPDARTLFFSSDGWPGMGNMDVFISRLDQKGKWGKAVNLGSPINSANDEMGFVVNANADKAYYSSDGMEGNLGGKDLFVFDLPADLRPTPVSYVKGKVIDAETKQHVAAAFELLNLETGELVVQSSASEKDGQFLLCLPPNQNYALNVSHPGYLFYSGNFDLSNANNANEPRLLEIALTPIKVGGAVVLKNVFFDSNSVVLKDQSRVELDKVAGFLSLNPNVSVELQGHTDNVGTAAFNADLSSKRAKAVADYLVTKGIAPQRLLHRGYGLTQPVADNTTEEGRALNRRTEMKVVGK